MQKYGTRECVSNGMGCDAVLCSIFGDREMAIVAQWPLPLDVLPPPACANLLVENRS